MSLATKVIAEMLAYQIEPRGTVLAWPCIAGGEFTLDKMVKPDTHVGVVFQDDASVEEIDVYSIETSFSENEHDLEFFRQDDVTVAKPLRSWPAQSILKSN